MDIEFAFHFLLVLVPLIFISLSLYSFSFVFKRKPTTENNPNGKLQVPPGSTGWPFIGETLEYLSLGRSGWIEKFISDRKNKYSTNLFKTSFLGENMVFLCSTEANKFLFSNENSLVKLWYPSIIRKIFPDSAKTNMAKETERTHRIVAMLSKPKCLQEYVGKMDGMGKEHLKMYWDQKEQVHVYPLAKKYTFEIVCRLLFNIQGPETLQQIHKLFTRVVEGMVSLPLNIPGTKFHAAIGASKKLRNKFEAIIKKRMSDASDSEEKNVEPRDLLSQMIMEEYEDGEYISVSDLANKMMGLMLGAYDTSSNLMVAIVKCLAEHPHVYERVRQEQMEIANSKGPNELLNYVDIKKMSYSWNVVREVLRLHPPIPGTFREAIKNFSYEGFLIPKGWKLHWTTYATHKNPEYFPNPEEFDPSRFEENIVPYSFVPFGGGRHICPGRELARLQVLVFMHNLVKRFRWERVFPDERMILDPFPMPTKGLPVRLYPLTNLC